MKKIDELGFFKYQTIEKQIFVDQNNCRNEQPLKSRFIGCSYLIKIKNNITPYFQAIKYIPGNYHRAFYHHLFW
jgi:hypothetical protein